MKIRVGKILTIVALSLVLLIVVVMVVSQTGWFRNWLREYAQTKTAHYLDADLTITKLEGNLYRDITLSGVVLTQHQKPVLTLDTLKVTWRPWRLFAGVVHIDSLVVDSLHATLTQNRDSTWNVTQLVRPDTLVPEPAPVDTSRAPRLVLANFVMRRSAVTLQTLDTTLPGQFNHIEIQASVSNDDSLRNLSLKRFSIDIPALPLTIKQLSLNVWQRKDSLALENLRITTLHNQIEGTGIYRKTDTSASVGSLQSEPIDFSEFNMLLPGIALHGNPRLTATVHYARDTLEINLGLTEHEQRADLVFTLGNLSRLLKSFAPRDVAYGMTADVANLDVASWVGDSSHAYILNGHILAEGTGIAPDSAKVQLTADLHQSILQGYPVDSFHVTGNYDGGDAVLNLFASGNFGQIKLDGEGTNLESNGEYTARLQVSNLDAGTFVVRDSLSSRLNFGATIHGFGFDKSMHGTAAIDVSRSNVNDIVIDTLFLRSTYTSRGAAIDSFQTVTNLGKFSAQGQIGADSTASLQYAFALDEIAPVGKLFHYDSLGGRVQLTGQVHGSFDSLTVDGTYSLDNLRYYAYSVRNLGGTFKANFADSVPSGSIQMNAREISGGGIAVDSVTVSTESDGHTAISTIHLQYGDSIKADIQAVVHPGQVTDIQLRRLTAAINGYHWEGGSDSTHLLIEDSSYTVRSLQLTSDAESNSPQKITIDGTFDMGGKNDIRLTVSGLQIASILKAVENDATVTGALSGTITLTGTSHAPLLDGHLELNGAASSDYKIEKATSDFHYADNRLAIAGEIMSGQQAHLTLSGTLPIALAFDHTGDRILRDAPAELNLVVSEFPFKAFKDLSTEIVPTDGILKGDMHLGNTLNSPALSGSLAITGGGFDMPRFGLHYTDFQTRLTADNTTIRLDTLSARSGNGVVTAKGYLKVDQGLMTGRIAAIDFEANSTGLAIAQHRDFQIALSGDASLKGNSDQSTFGGKITVERSSVYLPYLMEQAVSATTIDESQPPLLVAATGAPDTATEKSPIVPSDTAKDRSKVAQTDLYRNLRGTMRFSIPRNSWLRSPDMNIEISGDIDLVKQGEDFELFGTVQVLRGYYSLYGKRFNITEGGLQFTGGTDYNPELNLTANYTFRGAERERRLIEAKVTGTARNPIVAFTLDGTEIEERDAVAYILFGRSMDELTSGGTGGSLAGQGEDIAKGTATSLLANQLEQTLGSGLGLDVIDIQAQSGLSAATITVGKYLTENLFVSYQRGVGEFKDNDVTPSFVTLEYEITRYLLFQLSQGDPKSNGFDAIFRVGSR